jgi:hypothetical protein
MEIAQGRSQRRELAPVVLCLNAVLLIISLLLLLLLFVHPNRQYKFLVGWARCAFIYLKVVAYYGTSRKVAGSIPDEAIFLKFT